MFNKDNVFGFNAKFLKWIYLNEYIYLNTKFDKVDGFVIYLTITVFNNNYISKCFVCD